MHATQANDTTNERGMPDLLMDATSSLTNPIIKNNQYDVKKITNFSFLKFENRRKKRRKTTEQQHGMSSTPLPGRLRIKGVKDPMESAKNKKKKSKHSKKRSTENEDKRKNTETAAKVITGHSSEAREEVKREAYLRNETGLTETELKTMLRKSDKEKEYAKKIAQKSYRERIEEFNKKLSSTSEHFDMPRIGPG